jgi:hypothetical protein
MKTKVLGMLMGSFLFFVSVAAQATPEKGSLFIRVYNEQGVKISKGRLLSITKDGLVLKRGKKTVEVATSTIAFIKTKRALGRAMGIGGVMGGTAGAILGANTGSDLDGLFSDFGASESTNLDTSGMLAFGLLGAALGSGTGALIGVFNRSAIYEIQGQQELLLKFMAAVLESYR